MKKNLKHITYIMTFLISFVLSFVPFAIAAPGDINDSQTIDLTDAILALQTISGVDIQSTVIKENSIDKDNKIGIEDAIYALRRTADGKTDVTMEDLDLDPDFNFNTTKNISISIATNTPSNTPLSRVPFTIWDKQQDENFKLSQTSLTELAAKIPTDILSGLQDLKDIVYDNKDIFLDALGEKIGILPALEYESLILQYAEKDEKTALLTAVTDISGLYTNTDFTIPSYLDTLFIGTDYLGFPGIVPVNIVNNTMTFDYYTYFQNTIARASRITPRTGSVPAGYLTLGGWDSNGVPDYMEPVRDIVDSELMANINSSLPEGYKVPELHPEYLLENVVSKTVIVGDQDADIFITFVHEGAGYKNVLGFYSYQENSPPDQETEIANKTIIFPNVSFAGSGGGLITGDKVKIGRFSPGTVIEWFLFANGYKAPNVTEGNWIVYSDRNFNDESPPATGEDDLRQHVVHLQASGDRYVLGFEDIRRDNSGCDQDFNDAMFYVTSNPPSAISSANVAPISTPGESDSDSDGITDAFDDYKFDAAKAFNNYSTGTLAFEDLWPAKGDYDFNDLVTDYTFNRITNADNKVVEIGAEFIIRAIGASLDNGFAFQIDNLEPAAINSISDVRLDGDLVSGGGPILYEPSYITLAANKLEVSDFSNTWFASKAIVIVTDNLNKLMFDPDQRPSTMSFVNTQLNKPYITPRTVSLLIELNAPMTLEDLGAPPFNPFIFIDTTGSNPAEDWKRRQRELHLPDYTPTDKASFDRYLSAEDDSSISPFNQAGPRYYKTINHLPWVLHIPESFDYPIEFQDITGAHLHFVEWAETGGVSYPDWYRNIEGYRNSSLIYTQP
ncbi:LruC domain-containing protein [Desulfobacterales bacterium HSG17]|nr:LruC domain-containing protein [Desulfobacterales bacterium HSG17]